METAPRALEGGVLTIGLPGRSLVNVFFNIYNVSLPCVAFMVTLKTKDKRQFLSDDCRVTIEPCRMSQSAEKDM